MPTPNLNHPHNGVVESDFLGDEWTAQCDCGWESAAVGSMGEAEKLLMTHYSEIAL